MRRLGLYDLFLMDTEGNVIYTAEREDDFGTNLETGPYRDSGLARAYEQGRRRTYLTDFCLV